MSANQLHQLVLEGCTPSPLASYLKALGVLRLLGEQKPEWNVHGAWREDHFVLRSRVFSGDEQEDRQRLQAFFLEEYRPTPIVAPWNGGSGFYFQEGKLSERDPATGKKIKTGVRDQSTEATKTLDKILNGDGARLDEYRQVLMLAKSVIEKSGFQEAPKEGEKHDILHQLRGQLSDRALASLDSAVALASEKPGYAPLLGTGWNDGNLDFTNNFMQRITELIDPSTDEATAASCAWLPAALFDETSPGLIRAAVGQFYPGGVGGPNSTTGFDAKPLVNPWDFVLMLEGALFFATSVTRRLEVSGYGVLSYPFTIRSSGTGSGVLSLGDANQYEIWMPLWVHFSSCREINALLTEGRATVGRRAAKDGLDFARAVASLGSDRGIFEFQRYAFLERSGNNNLATPLARVTVRRNPDADLIEQLERGQFLNRLRQFARNKGAPARIRSHVRQLEDTLFELAQRSEPRTLQNVIIHIGTLSLLLGKSRKGQEAVPMPVPTLSEEWLLKADDGSPEFRMAAALAGLYCEGLPMRSFLTPVIQEKHGGWEWALDSRQAVWGEGDLPVNLGRVINRHRLEALRQCDGATPFQFYAGVSRGDVAAWLDGMVDEVRLALLLLGLVHVRIPKNLPSQGENAVLPAAYSILKPFFVPEGLLVHFGLLSPERTLMLPGEIVSRLQTGNVQAAVNIAWRRLRAVGYPLFPHPHQPPLAHGLNGPRLLAALAVPLSAPDLARCLGAMIRKPSNETV